MDSERESADMPFLSEKEHNELNRLEQGADGLIRPYHKRQPWVKRHWKAVLWHLLFNATTFVVLFFGVPDFFGVTCKSPIYDPGMPFKKFEMTDFKVADEDTNKFKPLTDTADKQWHDLMDYTYIRLTDEDLGIINRTSVPLGDGGWLGMPVMYHEIHCVKILRWATNMDRYSNMFGERDMVDLPKHAGHCIDVLRQSLMCRADLSPVTFEWIEGKRTPYSDFNSPHHCANWDSVMEYLTERHVQVNEPGVLNHPLYGPSYPGSRRVDELWDEPARLPPIPYTGKMKL